MDKPAPLEHDGIDVHGSNELSVSCLDGAGDVQYQPLIPFPGLRPVLLSLGQSETSLQPN